MIVNKNETYRGGKTHTHIPYLVYFYSVALYFSFFCFEFLILKINLKFFPVH